MTQSPPAAPVADSATSPSSSPLKGLAVATLLAGTLLVLVVLPAERNVDPTGFGRLIGLTALAAPPEQAAAPATAKPQGREDAAEVDVAPGKGVEYKFRIAAGERLTYAWKSSSGAIEFDFHGEPAGAPKDAFQSYAAGKSASLAGVLTAPFEGTHGWYWKNTGTRPARVSLTTSGVYEVLGVR